MNIPEEFRGILVIALSEYKTQKTDSLHYFVNRYHDSMNYEDLQCAFNCVHLYEKADEVLDLIGRQK